MKTFMVTYTVDRGFTKETKLVSADTYTKAYMQIQCTLPVGSIILDLFEVQ